MPATAIVNVHSNSLDQRARNNRRSVLAYLLLFTIGYGAIVEAAHSHGFASARASQVTTVSRDTNPESSYRDQSRNGDCSLCQFQRQLFGAFVHVIFTVQTPQQTAFHSQQTVFYLSTSALPPSGRAPPSI